MRWLDVALAVADVAGQGWALALVALALYSWLERDVSGVVKAFVPAAAALAGASGLVLLPHAPPAGEGTAAALFAAYTLAAYGRRGRAALALAAAVLAANAIAAPRRVLALAASAAVGAFLGWAAWQVALRLFPGGHLAALRAARRGGRDDSLVRASPPSA